MRHDEQHKCYKIRTFDRWGEDKCGRPTKGDMHNGKPICRICLAGIKRAEQNANKGAEERRKEREFADEVRALLEPLNISGHATGYRHRQCIVNFDELVRLFRGLSYSTWCDMCDNVNSDGRNIDQSRCQDCDKPGFAPTNFKKVVQ